jgi:hypothetical protein
MEKRSKKMQLANLHFLVPVGSFKGMNGCQCHTNDKRPQKCSWEMWDLQFINALSHLNSLVLKGLGMAFNANF